MKRAFLFLIISILCGCSAKEPLHVCTMTNDNIEWKVEYTLDEEDQLVHMAQILNITCRDEQEKADYDQSVAAVFEAYLDHYGEACQVENKDNDLMIERILSIDFTKLSEEKKEEMGYESQEEYLIAQLEFAGYQCK